MIEIRPAGRGAILLAEQLVPLPPERVVPFFAAAENLEAITPPWLRFSIVTEDPEIFAGAVIDYRLRLHGLPLRWRTEITVWDPPRRFVDTQLEGPYRLWQHEHAFRPHPEGTMVFDRVRFRAPGPRFATLGPVARDVRAVFRFRETALLRALGVPGEPRSG